MTETVLPELQVVASTGSTNDDVMAIGREGAPHGSCVVAHEQTAGRGRRGHGWGSPSSGLYLSVLLRPDVPMGMYMGISAVCGLAVRDALHELGAAKAALKWPNDVVVPGEDGEPDRKLCGMLVEAGTGQAGMFAVCGIGVNLELPQLEGDMGSVNPLHPAALADAMGGPVGCAAPDAVNLPGAVDGEPAGGEQSCRAEGEKPPVPTFDELAAAIRNHVVARVDAWAADVCAGRAVAGPLAPILSEYFDALPLMGREVNVVYPNGNVAATGTFCAVDVWGRATVRTADDKELVISSEQASIRAI